MHIQLLLHFEDASFQLLRFLTRTWDGGFLAWISFLVVFYFIFSLYPLHVIEGEEKIIASGSIGCELVNGLYGRIIDTCRLRRLWPELPLDTSRLDLGRRVQWRYWITLYLLYTTRGLYPVSYIS